MTTNTHNKCNPRCQIYLAHCRTGATTHVTLPFITCQRGVQAQVCQQCQTIIRDLRLNTGKSLGYGNIRSIIKQDIGDFEVPEEAINALTDSRVLYQLVQKAEATPWEE